MVDMFIVLCAALIAMSLFICLADVAVKVWEAIDRRNARRGRYE